MKRLLLTAATLFLFGVGLQAQTIYLEEDFENGFPATWSQSTNANDGGWLTGTGPALSSSAFSIPSHTTVIATNDDGCNCDKSADSLFTDTVDLTSATGGLVLKFDLIYSALTYNGSTEDLNIYAKTVGGSGWSLLSDLAPTQSVFVWDNERLVDVSAYAGDEVIFAFVYNDGGGWLYGAALDNVVVTSLPSYDVAHLSLNLPAYAPDGEDVTIGGTIQNNGSETITSMTISYNVDGGTAVTDQLTGLNIASLATYEYTLPTEWTATLQGSGMLEVQNVEATVTLINGNNDANTANNTVDADVNVHAPGVTRKPLLEQFTSSTCPPCTPGNINVLGILANYPGEFSKINYQMSWPGNGDPYFTEEGGERRTYYNVTGVPTMFTDGENGLNSNSYTAEFFEDALAVPSYLNLSVEGTVQLERVFEVQAGALVQVDSMYHLEVSAAGSPLIDMPAGLRVFLSVQEDLTYENVETNGETEFHDVMKKMLPDASGTILSAVTAEDTFAVAESHDFPVPYRLPASALDPVDHTIENTVEEWDDLRVVVWVQNTTTGEIWQSENAEITFISEVASNVTTDTVDGQLVYIVDGEQWVDFNGEMAPLGANEGVADLIKFFPNPTTGMLNVEGVEGATLVRVMDAAGRLVLQSTVQSGRIDLSDLEAGVYTVSIDNNGLQTVEKVTLLN